MGAVFFWIADGAGVQVIVILFSSGFLHCHGNMGMSLKEDISIFLKGKALCVIDMAVGKENSMLSPLQDGIVRHDRKVQYHLIHLCLAVSPNRKDFFLYWISEGYNLLGGIVSWQRISGSMVQNISQK